MTWSVSEIFKGIGSIFKPVADAIDAVHTSDEERLQAHAALATAQAATYAQVIGLEAELVKARQQVLVAEIQGQSWMQRNWRPITMLSFVAIIVNNYILFPYLPSAEVLEIPPGMWNLLQIGIGGYIVGRSGEKIINNLNLKKAAKTEA